MKILILGSSGFLGSRLLKLLQQNYEVLGTFNHHGNETNITRHWNGDLSTLLIIINYFQPQLIINCVGFADVDLSEVLPEKANYLNAIIPFQVSKISAAFNIKFVHISTDHFEGNQSFAALEDTQVSCLNQYSRSKLLGEYYVKLVNNQSIVLRSNFFHFNLNSSKTFLDKCLNDPVTFENISGFDDIFFTPISTIVLKSSIMKLVSLKFSGLINISSNEIISKYSFLKEILSILQRKNQNVHPKSHTDNHLLATRPQNMALSNQKYRNLTGCEIPSLITMIKMELEHSEFL